MTPHTDDTTAGRLLARIHANERRAGEASGGELREAPLSFTQRQLWYLDQRDSGRVDYVIPVAYRITGPLDPDRLAAALSGLIERHHVLRTRFTTGPDGEPVQLVGDPEPCEMTVLDLRNVADAAERATRAAAEEAARPFDLASGRPVRALLVRCDAEESLLVLCLHHMVADGWTVGVLIRDLCALYESGSLPALPMQFADFAVRQRARLTDDRARRELAHWRSRLEGAPTLELPTDHPRGPVRTGDGGQVRFTVPKELTRALRRRAAAQGASLFMVALTAFQVVMAEWSGQRDIVVGSAVAGRTDSDLENLAGVFANMLALRTRMGDGVTLGDLIDQVKTATLEAHDHQDLPFERLVAVLAPERDPSGGNPLFQVTFSLLTGGGNEHWSIPGLTARAVDVAAPRARFDVECQLVEEDDGTLQGEIGYASDLFEPATVDRMARHFLRALGAVARDPGLRADSVDLLDDAERHELTRGLGHTAAAGPRVVAVHRLIEEQAARTPGAVAVVENGAHVSYRELNARANRLSRLLAARGVGPGVLVAVCAGRRIDTVVTLLAVWKAGAAYVPVDPDHPDERLKPMLSGIALLATQEPYTERMARLTTVPQFVLDLERDAVAAQDDGDPEPLARPGEPACVLYTSGTTGSPKGVQITHRALAHHLLWCADAYDLGRGSGSLVHSSLGCNLTVTALFGPLLVGGRVRMLSGGIAELAAALRHDRDLTLVKLTPTQLKLVSRLLIRAGRVRTLVVGGEALRAETIAAISAGGTRVVNEYGPAETVAGSIAYQVGADLPERGAVPIGRPTAGTRAYVLDARGRPVVRGGIGELHLAGAGVAQGYAGRPGATADRFLPCPYGPPGARMFRTGDLVRLSNDGLLSHVGRVDDRVEPHGLRIGLGEIETVLAGHEDIECCALTLHADGTGRRRPLAVYVPVPGRTPARDSLNAWCRRHLPGHMIPTRFTAVDSLPLMPNGKLDPAGLSAPVPAPAPPGDGHVPPRTAAEHTIAAVWRDVLGVERVGLEDNFFDLGGQSLMAVRITNRLRQQGIELTVRDIMQQQTVGLIATALEPGPEPGEG